jgi:hypothetical protein
VQINIVVVDNSTLTRRRHPHKGRMARIVTQIHMTFVASFGAASLAAVDEPRSLGDFLRELVQPRVATDTGWAYTFVARDRFRGEGAVTPLTEPPDHWKVGRHPPNCPAAPS